MPWPVLISRGKSTTSCFERSWNRRFLGWQARKILKKFRWKMWNQSEVKQLVLLVGGGGLNHLEPPSWKICASQIGINFPKLKVENEKHLSCYHPVIAWSFSPSQMEPSNHLRCSQHKNISYTSVSTDPVPVVAMSFFTSPIGIWFLSKLSNPQPSSRDLSLEHRKRWSEVVEGLAPK